MTVLAVYFLTKNIVISDFFFFFFRGIPGAVYFTIFRFSLWNEYTAQYLWVGLHNPTHPLYLKGLWWVGVGPSTQVFLGFHSLKKKVFWGFNLTWQIYLFIFSFYLKVLSGLYIYIYISSYLRPFELKGLWWVGPSTQVFMGV